MGDASGTTCTTLVLFQALIMATDLLVFHTGDAFLAHGLVVSNAVFGEPSFFPDQDIQHHSRHGKAEKDYGYNQDL
jgi:hypothetical protein